MRCNYPACDGGYATGYCHVDCRDDWERRVDGYKRVSQTTSGWIISTNPDAPLEKRWCATHCVHKETKFFDAREKVLDFTINDLAERMKRRLYELGIMR